MKPGRPWRLRTATLSPVSVVPEGPSKVVPQAHQNEASPSLTGLRTAKLSLCSWASGKSSGVTPYADQNESSPSLGAANCETVATFVGPWGSSGVASYADQNKASPSPRGCELRNCRHVRGLLGGPAQSRHTQIRMKPRTWRQFRSSPPPGTARFYSDLRRTSCSIKPAQRFTLDFASLLETAFLPTRRTACGL